MTGYLRFKRDFQGKKILILGLGKLGSSLGNAKFFAQIGCQLRITDLKPEKALINSLGELKEIEAQFILGKHRLEDIDWADVIVRNAAVPWRHPLLEHARNNSKLIVMDSQLLVTYAPSYITVIGITGTRGKTTTTKLVYSILKTYLDKPVYLGGNIRNLSTLPLLQEFAPDTSAVVVLELSSWQLQAFDAHHISPHIAVITNYYQDHLNTYTNMAEYIEDKRTIAKYQNNKDILILNQDQKDQHQGWLTMIKSQIRWFKRDDLPFTPQWSLIGNHNLENAAAAYRVLQLFSLKDTDIQKGMDAFTPEEFRLQLVHNGLFQVFNDSNATTPIATIKAIESIKRPIVLICGGEDKKLDIDALVATINHKVKKVILLKGSGTDRIKSLLKPEIVVGEYANLKTALATSLDQISSNEVLLFSPAFTSFGLFDNEYHRGESFTQELRHQILK